MVFKDYTFFSYVFLATTVILLTCHAHGAGLCDNSPNKQVCDSIVYNRTDPRDAVVAACHKLVTVTKGTEQGFKTKPNSTEFYNCVNYCDHSIALVKDALKSLNANQPRYSRASLIAAQTNYKLCDDGFQYSGQPNPIAKATKLLQDMASVGAYLSTLIK